MYDGQADERGDAGADMAALIARFDPLLEGKAVSAEDEAEMRTLAGVFDLEASGPPDEVWRALRPVLDAQAPPADEPDSSEALTLLVVEDDPEMAADLVDLLLDTGHRVVGPFHGAEAALAAVALHPVDLALLDINLSGEGTGLDLARSLKGTWGVASIILSGDITAAARHADLALALVLKPYRPRQVLDAIHKARSVLRAKAGATKPAA